MVGGNGVGVRGSRCAPVTSYKWAYNSTYKGYNLSHLSV